MMKIAILDDDLDAGTLISRVVASLGFGFDIYTNPLEAVTAVPAGNYSLLTLDVSMPVMDGYEAAGRIKFAAPHLPIVVVSALPTTQEAIRFLSGGADSLGVAYFQKPVNIAELGDVIRRYSVPTVRGYRLRNNSLVGADGVAVKFSPREAELVSYLISHPGAGVEELISAMSPNPSSAITEKTVRTFIGRARAKISGAGLEIIYGGLGGYSVV